MPRLTLSLAFQMAVAGPLFSLFDGLQAAVTREAANNEPAEGAIVILGYWRSGTTLLHGYLALDPRFAYPTTFACFNPHHFLLAPPQQSAPAGVRRPMDHVLVTPDSPQEDEFALLALGARSPYEALLFPNNLPACLKLSDYSRLTRADQENWDAIFLRFMRNLTAQAGGRPLILKSPPHANRVAAIRRLLPNSRFVLIVRDPYAVFESNIRMWSSMFDRYALQGSISDTAIREAVLEDRMRFEAALITGLEEVPMEQLHVVTYEQLAAQPVQTIDEIYAALRLEMDARTRKVTARTANELRDVRSRTGPVPQPWRDRVRAEWLGLFQAYNYDPNRM